MERLRQLQRQIVPSPAAQSATPLSASTDLSLLDGLLTDEQRQIRARASELSNRILGTPEVGPFIRSVIRLILTFLGDARILRERTISLRIVVRFQAVGVDRMWHERLRLCGG